MANLISLGRLIDSSLDLYKKYWKEFLGISLWLLAASLPRLLGNLLAPLGAGPSLTAGDWLSFGVSFLGGLIIAVVGIWVTTALIQIADSRAKGKAPDLKAIGWRSWRLFFNYVWVSILVILTIAGASLLAAPGVVLLIIGSQHDSLGGMLTILGSLLLFAGGMTALVLVIKFSLELSLAPYALVLDDKRGIKALSACFALVKGRWWATFILYSAPTLLYLFVIVLLNLLVPAGLLLLSVVAAPNSIFLAKGVYVVAYLFTAGLSAVSAPLFAITYYLLYDSLKNSK